MTATIDSLRAKHRVQRKTIDRATLDNNAAKLAVLVETLEVYQVATHVAAYIAIQGEISVEPIMRAATAKQFYLPILRGEQMAFAPWQIDQPLVERKYGLQEPDCDESCWMDARELDLVLAPLVVFDDQCNRIGQGGGYYDRTFEFTKSGFQPKLVGVAHQSQREPSLDPQPWDIPLDYIVTEQSVFTNRSGG